MKSSFSCQNVNSYTAGNFSWNWQVDVWVFSSFTVLECQESNTAFVCQNLIFVGSCLRDVLSLRAEAGTCEEKFGSLAITLLCCVAISN